MDELEVKQIIEYARENGVHANLMRADLMRANLMRADLRGANLSGANLSGANLSDADLRFANLRFANLGGANLMRADLSDADLRGANLSGANLSDADLSGADLMRANLMRADLRGANLSGAKGLLNPIEWLTANFEQELDVDGDMSIVAYKTFGSTKPSPDGWKIKAGSIIEEVVDPLPTTDCGCGINVATLEWCKNNILRDKDIWKLHIKLVWLISAVVPYHTDGKWRVGKARLVEVEGGDK